MMPAKQARTISPVRFSGQNLSTCRAQLQLHSNSAPADAIDLCISLTEMVRPVDFKILRILKSYYLLVVQITLPGRR